MEKKGYREIAEQWVAWDPNKLTKREIQSILEDKSLSEEECEKKLVDCFSPRISFGTAGLRAKMAAGPKYMNDLVIIQTNQGLCQYLTASLGVEEVKKRGVVIGFDHRKNKKRNLSSKNFAIYTALMFAEKGVKVWMFSDLIATPFVPYAVNYLKAAAGIMVTASHNPKADNGFKVYWGNGCQIIPPHDKNISKAILENLKPSLKSKISDFSELQLLEGAFPEVVHLLDPVNSEVVKSYFETVVQKLCRHRETNQSYSSKIVYTPMHGVGEMFTSKMLHSFGFKSSNIFYVNEQKDPDPNFSTVVFPNPEEKNALDLAMSEADKLGARLIIANDPDADRLAVAEKCVDNDSWKVFSGNEIGAMLAYWQLNQHNDENKRRKVGENGDNKPKTVKPAMVVSTVSSKLVRQICKIEGVEYFETLTGFKWLGNKCVDLVHQTWDPSIEFKVLFAYEEAIGFCVGDVVFDKDGISAAAVLCELAASLDAKSHKESLQSYLKRIHEKYGYFKANNGYVVINDEERKIDIMKKLQQIESGFEFGEDGDFKRYKVTKVRDDFPGSGLVLLEVDGGIEVALRLSGTEPKLKYYTEASGTDPEKLKKFLQEFVEIGLVNDLIKV